MAYCGPLGIPHSAFLSWDESDQDKALEWAREQATVCACGTRRSEWTQDPDAYVADSWICPGCERVSEAQEQVHEKARGVRHGLIPRAVAAARPEVDNSVATQPRRASPNPDFATMGA